MAGYSRQSIADIIANTVIKAAPINAEYNAIQSAFTFATGHKHDGSSTEGAYIPLIADPDALNKVVVDAINNRVSFYSQVGVNTVEQLRIQDGAIVPVIDEDIDLGAVGAEFKDIYIDGIGYIDTIQVHENATVAGTLSVTGLTSVVDLTSSGTITGNVTGNLTGDSAGTHTGVVTGLPTPSASSDATPKIYVDTEVAAVVTYAGTAVASEASMAAIYDQFDDRYLGAKATNPSVDNDGNALITGALYWNTTVGITRAYTGLIWADVGSIVNGTAERYIYTATAGQTTFSAVYELGFIDVFMNGLKLQATVDFTATNGTSIVLTVAATLNDSIDIVAYGVFTVADVYSQAASDARFAAIDIDTLPTQSGNNGKFLTTDGSAASWASGTGAQRVIHTAGTGQTVFNATYTVGFVDVFLNGMKLQVGTDFTGTTGTNITLTTAALLGDVIDITAFSTFSLPDTYTQGQVDSLLKFEIDGGVSSTAYLITQSVNGGSANG